MDGLRRIVYLHAQPASIMNITNFWQWRKSLSQYVGDIHIYSCWPFLGYFIMSWLNYVFLTLHCLISSSCQDFRRATWSSWACPVQSVCPVNCVALRREHKAKHSSHIHMVSHCWVEKALRRYTMTAEIPAAHFNGERQHNTTGIWYQHQFRAPTLKKSKYAEMFRVAGTSQNTLQKIIFLTIVIITFKKK